MADKQNQTSIHREGRDYHHADKTVKHHAVGTQSGGRNNPATKGGDHKHVRPSGSHRAVIFNSAAVGRC
jgi:hypothetical protein